MYESQDLCPNPAAILRSCGGVTRVCLSRAVWMTQWDQWTRSRTGPILSYATQAGIFSCWPA